jgi:hypothetical protein
MKQTKKGLLAAAALCFTILSGCADERLTTGADASVFTFDAAMLNRDIGPDDVGTDVPALPDVSVRRDSGRRDAGARDAGRDTYERECRGLAPLCSNLSRFSCTGTLGCRDDSSCGGSPDSCSWQRSSFSCNDLDGCYWRSSDRRCSGVARGCFGYSSSFSCGGQGGCYWRERCGGVARSCFELGEFTCSSQLGCRWE